MIAVVAQNDADEQIKLLAAGYADTVALPTTASRLGRLMSYHLPDDDEDEELLALYVENARRHLAALEKAEDEDDTAKSSGSSSRGKARPKQAKKTTDEEMALDAF